MTEDMESPGVPAVEDEVGTGGDAGSGGHEAGDAGLVILLMPLLEGKRVLVLGDEQPWRQVGASQLKAVAPGAGSRPLPVADEAFDVVLLPELPEESSAPPLDGDGAMPPLEPLLDELRRVLAPSGSAIIRLGDAAQADAVGPLLERRFPLVRRLSERPFVGVFYGVAGTEEMAIAGDLASLNQGDGRQILLCSRTTEPVWSVVESLFIPLAEQGPPISAEVRAEALARVEALEEELARVRAAEAAGRSRLGALALELDELREALLTRQDRTAQSEAALLAIRRESARHLSVIANQSEKLEHLGRLQGEAERRVAAAEQALADLEVALRRRSMDVAALERELGRVRQRRA